MIKNKITVLTEKKIVKKVCTALALTIGLASIGSVLDIGVSKTGKSLSLSVAEKKVYASGYYVQGSFSDGFGNEPREVDLDNYKDILVGTNSVATTSYEFTPNYAFHLTGTRIVSNTRAFDYLNNNPVVGTTIYNAGDVYNDSVKNAPSTITAYGTMLTKIVVTRVDNSVPSYSKTGRVFVKMYFARAKYVNSGN